ncbi:MAG: glycosyltransferase [Frankia sp.]|nr:glycosyltransferase [Frankia sp.]
MTAPANRPAASGAPVLVDCAGALMGGALRFLTELDGYLAGDPARADGVRLIGRGRRLDARWLATRERQGTRRRAVALNNIGFVTGRGERWVLMRNMLHVLRPGEAAALPGGLPRRAAASAALARAAARRADVVVVPTSEMAARVAVAVPGVAHRLVVRPHPLSMPTPVPADDRVTGRLLCPVLFSRFKAMGPLLRLADAAAAQVAADTGLPVEIVVTATEQEAAAEELAGAARLRLVGRLSPAALEREQRRCQALLYPTRLESFGYPLAEARLAGLPVVALGSARNREVAGPVLVPYEREDVDAIAAAVRTALIRPPRHERGNPFDPVGYFDWLLDRPGAAPWPPPTRVARPAPPQATAPGAALPTTEAAP